MYVYISIIIYDYIHTDGGAIGYLVVDLLLPDYPVVTSCALFIPLFEVGETKRISCRSGVTGRIVRITYTESIMWDKVSLVEVKVYGIYGKT